jgi:hypothetical protein
MYRVATHLIQQLWNKPLDINIADALGVLLLTWNRAFYRYGQFNFFRLEKLLRKNKSRLNEYRKRNIKSLSTSDEKFIKSLFDKLNSSLSIDSGQVKGRKSPVATAKALHLLAPNFFPIWDEEIAKAYHCKYSSEPEMQYLKFCYLIKKMASEVSGYKIKSNKNLLKLIDQYNYSKYTKEWI